MRRVQIPVALNAKRITDKGTVRPIYKEFLENEKVKDNSPIEERAKDRTVYRRTIDDPYTYKKLHNFTHCKKNSN